MKDSVDILAEQLWKFKFPYDEAVDWEVIKRENPVNSSKVIEAARNMMRIARLRPIDDSLDLRLKSTLISK